MSRIGVESAFEVLVKARALEKQGKSVIHLEIGEPDFPTPENIKQAGIDAIHENFTRYTAMGGTLELRSAPGSIDWRRTCASTTCAAAPPGPAR